MSKKATRDLVLAHLTEVAARGAPAPSMRAFAEDLQLSAKTLSEAIKDLCADGHLKEDYPSMALAKRRFYVTEIDRWTKYSGRFYRPKGEPRACITGCGTTFDSEGPHHRMCTRCRTSDTSSFAPRGAIMATRRSAPTPHA